MLVRVRSAMTETHGLFMHGHQVNIIRIRQQLQNFQDYQQKLAAFVGEDAATQLVNQALVLITLGGNDFVNNYYLVPFSIRSRQFAIQDYVPYLVFEYKKILSVSSSALNFRIVLPQTAMKLQIMY
jgi:hypothetical protein